MGCYLGVGATRGADRSTGSPGCPTWRRPAAGEEERQGTQRASERSGKPQVGHVPSLAAGRAGLRLEWLREAGECGQPASRVGGGDALHLATMNAAGGQGLGCPPRSVDLTLSGTACGCGLCGPSSHRPRTQKGPTDRPVLTLRQQGASGFSAREAGPGVRVCSLRSWAPEQSSRPGGLDNQVIASQPWRPEARDASVGRVVPSVTVRGTPCWASPGRIDAVFSLCSHTVLPLCLPSCPHFPFS